MALVDNQGKKVPTPVENHINKDYNAVLDTLARLINQKLIGCYYSHDQFNQADFNALLSFFKS